MERCWMDKDEIIKMMKKNTMMMMMRKRKRRISGPQDTPLSCAILASRLYGGHGEISALRSHEIRCFHRPLNNNISQDIYIHTNNFFFYLITAYFYFLFFHSKHFNYIIIYLIRRIKVQFYCNILF